MSEIARLSQKFSQSLLFSSFFSKLQLSLKPEFKVRGVTVLLENKKHHCCKAMARMLTEAPRIEMGTFYS